MQAHFWIIFCLLLNVFCFLEGSIPFEQDPHAIVANHVDTVSGAWIEKETDLFVSSRVPFVLRRYYSSECGNWIFFPHCSLVRSTTASSDSLISTFESNGTPLRFVQPEKQHSYQLTFSEQDPLCNTAHGAISSGTNYTNFICTEDNRHIVVTHPDGTKRTYEKTETSTLGPLCAPFSVLRQQESLKSSHFRLISETFPTQGCIQYTYDTHGRLSALEFLHDPKQAGRIVTFFYEKESIHATLDGKKLVSYSFVDGKLIRVDRVQKPTIRYTYRGMLLIKKELPQNRFEEIVYDKNSKVCALFGPLTKEPLYTFQYSDGLTQVRNARGYTIHFRHAIELLQSVAMHDDAGLYRIDRFVWSSDKLVKRLIAHTTHAKEGNCLWASTNEYTDDGNLVRSKIYSTATDQSEACIELDRNGVATGEPESETPTCIYKGPFGAISEQNDGAGNWIEYKYKQGTGLLLQKIERNKRRVKSRSFYQYDKTSSALIRKVHDNGEHTEENDLYWVTERTVTEIQPRTYPKEGLDEEVIVQKCYDAESRSEKLAMCLRLFYDTDNNLVRKELYDTQDVLAKTEEFSYDSHGNCTRYVNALGEVVLRAYDENDNCIRIEECASGCTRTFKYDVTNLLLSTNTIYRDGSNVTTSSVYDSFGNKIISLDRYGNLTEYGYDLFSRQISVTYPEVLDETGHPFRPRETAIYDIFNNVIMKTDPKGYTERSRFRSSGKPLHVDYPDGTHEQFDYVGEKVQAITNRDESKTSYRYDADKHLLAVETFSGAHCIMQQKFAYNLRSDKCKEAQRPTGSVVFRTYDCYGRVVSESETTETIRSANLQYHAIKTNYEYDTLHRPARMKRWTYLDDFVVECLQYDSLDRVIARWIEEPDGTKSSHQVFVHDAFGNISECISHGSCEKIEYIEDTKPQRITHPDGSVTRIEYDETQYNLLGQRYLEKIIIDPSGMRNSIVYDALGRQVQVIAKDLLGVQLACREQFFDANSNLCTTLEAKNNTQTVCTEWIYGSMDRLELLREAAGTDVERVTRYTYNTVGKLIRASLSDGTGCSYEYGIDGTLTKMLNAKGEVVSKLSFNNFGQCVGGESSDKVKTRRTYTPQGLISEEVFTDEYGSYTNSFYYDGLGRMRSASLPDRTNILYEYVGTRPKSVNLYSLRDCKHEFTKWDETGAPVEEKLITGELQTRQYAPGHALSSIQSPYFSQSILKRDQRGNPLTIEQDTTLSEYTYNMLNQLIVEKSTKKNESYNYDSLGTIVSHNDSQFQSNALNQVTSPTCTYDSRGNLLSDGTFSFTYNDNNQLIEAKDTISGKSVAYRWDVFGRRISRLGDGTVRRFLYVGNSEVGAIGKDGSLTELKVPERVVGNEASGTVFIILKSSYFVPITDLFGNIVKLVDTYTKKAVMSYEYDAYGHEEIFSHYEAEQRFRRGEENPWRYRGLRTDPFTKHVQFTFRDYSSKLLRFLTPDPAGYDDGPNLYGYAKGNPISYIDLIGLETKKGACLCHGLDCEYYKSGVCGHGAGITIEEERPPRSERKVKEFFDYEQALAKERAHRDCTWPVNYSRSFDVQGEIVPGKGFGFINGVGNTFLDAHTTALYMSGLAGAKNIQLTYAASNGLPPDVRQAAYNLFGFYATNATKIVHDTWVTYFEANGPDARYLQVCHSWGAIHVRNALMMLDRKYLNQIDVLAIAPGAYIDRNLCRYVKHLINDEARRDPITRLDRVGLKIALSQDTVEMVKSHPDASFFDHTVLSETYREHMYEFFKNYNRN